MFSTMRRLMLMACLLSTAFWWPSSSWALGLGEIHLRSALNEPMNAEIDLIAATPDELTALRASLADREAFTRYGIDRPAFLSSLSFKVGKGKDGRDALLVRSSDAIPEPFVTFLVEVNWARGRLMREYTVLLDPPVYTPGETARSTAPVSAPTVTAPPARRAAPAPGATAPPSTGRAAAAASSSGAASPVAASAGGASEAAAPISGGSYRVAQGDTLAKIARSLRADSGAATPANIDQTMMAVYRANPDAFGGNINILRRGAVLRLPGADQIAALNQSEAISEVHRQMDAWRGAGGGATQGHLRLVTPGTGGATGGGGSTAANAEAQALKDRVKDLEAQLAASHRLIDIRNSELSALQRKLGVSPTAPPPAPIPEQKAPVQTTPAPPATAAQPPAAAPPAPAPLPPAAESTSPPVPVPAPAPAVKVTPAAPAPVSESGSWLDWLAAHWWAPAAVIIALFVLLALAWRRRQGGISDLNRLDDTDIAGMRDPAFKPAGTRKGDDSFLVEESGEHRMPDIEEAPDRLRDTHTDIKAADDTMSSESAVNLDQGDPLAEADFHMAYGLYDQAADLVRIALEREPDRRDLRLKLLEIYFVWGNKDAFLQTAKGLEATRDRAPAGEWDKIVIMGKQICPDEPMFAASAGSGRGAGALVDLNLEGGENRVDIDLFGDPDGEHGKLDHAKESGDIAATGESPAVRAGSDLDFTLDSPERGADESPTREMPPRDEPTVESELMNFADAPTAESPTLKPSTARDPLSKLGPAQADQTAEVSIDDLGLDLDQLEETGTPAVSGSHLEETDHPTDHPSDAPTMVAGLDEKSRRMMAEAEKSSRDRDLTELERELEASFVADLGQDHDEVKTAVLGPESSPTVQMPRDFDADTSRFKSSEFSDVGDAGKLDVDSTSKLRGLGAAALSGDSIDLDLDRLASALGSGDTVEQPRAEDEVFSSEVFEASQRSKRVDLDVGEAMNGAEAPTNKLQSISSTSRTAKLKADDHALPELEPVTMSEVGTKLDLARAYMDMGDPEGARSILEEVVHEGSASQKQEAQRLIETLPG
ncbi:MAG: FimV/HubP family polar landmark protein [Steroidobacteraceae bacterium]